jgi:outer membrane protein assembly factor BamE (lipoprotein component of BamABCDE complex)
MLYRMRGVLGLLLAGLLASCSSAAFHVGNDFDVQTVAASIERGTTTQAQVKAWLGPPTATGMRVESDGETFVEWTYYYATGTLTDAANARLKTLQLKFDNKNVVRGFSWNESQR